MCKRKYITFGRFNKKYFFILGSIIVRYIITFINGFTPFLTPNKSYYIFGSEPFFASHPLLILCIQYFSIFLGGVILEIIYHKREKNKEKDSDLEYKTTLLSNDYNINVNDGIVKEEIDKEYKSNDKKYFLRIFSVLSIYYFSQTTINTLNSLQLKEINFWPLEFIFLFFFSKKILKRTIYKHQRISIIILIIVCSIIYILNSFIKLSDEDCSKLNDDEVKECIYLNKNIYGRIIMVFDSYYIPIFIIIYLIAMVGDSYYTVYNKWFTDIKYITIERIVLYIGIIGFFYSLILFVILSNIPCGDDQGLLEHICKFDVDRKYYYDNFLNLAEIELNPQLFIDIFVTLILYMIASFLNMFFEILIITYLDPFYLIPINSFYNFIYVIIDYSLTIKQSNEYRDLKFTCNIISYSLSVILSSIHLEMIELHFCHCDRFLRRYIIKREIEDKSFIITYDINDINDEASET